MARRLVSRTLFVDQAPVHATLLLLRRRNLIGSVPCGNCVITRGGVSGRNLLRHLRLVTNLVVGCLRCLGRGSVTLSCRLFRAVLRGRARCLSCQSTANCFGGRCEVFRAFVTPDRGRFLGGIVVAATHSVRDACSSGASLVSRRHCRDRTRLLRLCGRVTIYVHSGSCRGVKRCLLFFFRALGSSGSDLTR